MPRPPRATPLQPVLLCHMPRREAQETTAVPALPPLLGTRRVPDGSPQSPPLPGRGGPTPSLGYSAPQPASTEPAARARAQAAPRPPPGLPAHPDVADRAKQPGTEQTPGYGDETIPGLGRSPHGCSPEPDRDNRVILGPRRYTRGRAPRGPARHGRPRSAAAGDHRGR